MRYLHAFLVCPLLAVNLAINAPAQTSSQSEQPQNSSSSAPAQTSSPPEQPQHPASMEGTIVSVSRQTMVVRTDDKQFHLFVFDSDMIRPKGLTPGSRIRVVSNPTDETGVRLATGVAVLEPASTSPSAAPPDMARPPKEMLGVQREIEKQVRRWQLGVRLGAGLDPELFLIGVQTAIGPIFSRDFYLRPNVDFAFGELTDMAAINLEGAYRLPITFRHGRWSAYVGAGPGLNFVHQGVGRRDISFSNFDYETGLNVFSGMRFRRGTFVEVKTTLWARSVPTLRLIFGYTF
jgi:hypothetical protein